MKTHHLREEVGSRCGHLQTGESRNIGKTLNKLSIKSLWADLGNKDDGAFLLLMDQGTLSSGSNIS